MTDHDAKVLTLAPRAFYRLKFVRGVLQDVIKIQGSDGNWNYSPYMLGLLNGLLLAQGWVEGEEPKLRLSPAEWLKDRPPLENALAVESNNPVDSNERIA